jgi:hypothetical protein
MQISLRILLIIAALFFIASSVKAETIYLPIMQADGPLVHAYTFGRGMALSIGDGVEIHCEYSVPSVRVEGRNVYVECE